MARLAPVVFDFETEAIEPRPDYPPKPVGLAVYAPGAPKRYLAFGHPEGNNATREDARNIWLEAVRSGRPIAFHNAQFDVDVAETHLGLPIPKNLFCTMVLAFLFDPNSERLGLKELAEDLLDEPPTERDALRDWVLANVPEARRAKTRWGRYISRAPGRVAAPYAIGDVVRTRALFDALYPYVRERSMLEAHHREMRLIPVLLRNERRGIPVDVARIRSDARRFVADIDEIDRWLRRRLKKRDLDVDKNEELADALERADVVTEFKRTAKGGKRSVAKDSIEEAVTDPRIVAALRYRGQLATSLRTFVRPWARMAEYGGRIYTTWRPTAREGEKKKVGARTGRLSSSPNFQNVPKEVTPLDERNLALALLRRLSPPPNPRTYIVPEKGQWLLQRDYSQQELRILAHYGGGVLADLFREEPLFDRRGKVRMDLHEQARSMINAMLDADFERKPIKNTGFGIIYGMGLAKLMDAVGAESRAAAGTLRNAYKDLFPGIREVERWLADLHRRGEPLRTWGGREYYVEDPRVVRGRTWTFEYKQINTLIQGSAGDCLKEAWIRYDDLVGEREDERLYLTVHDECVGSAADRERGMRHLREAMESVEFDVPMLSDGKVSKRSWAAARHYNDRRTE